MFVCGILFDGIHPKGYRAYDNSAIQPSVWDRSSSVSHWLTSDVNFPVINKHVECVFELNILHLNALLRPWARFLIKW